MLWLRELTLGEALLDSDIPPAKAQSRQDLEGETEILINDFHV
jgi:hypothetical protein